MKRRRSSRVVLMAVIGLIFATPLRAEETLPLWEVGLGVGVASFPAYRGSERQRTFVLPAPYFVYRGDFFKADRDGLRGVFFASDWLEINVSLAATIPVKSDGDSARQGMPDLRPTMEIGPSLNVGLWRSADLGTKVELRVPVRAAFEIGGGFERIGATFTPSLNVDVRDPFGFRRWNLGMLAGPIYADAPFWGYFYDVAADEVRPGRSAYSAEAGYGGTHIVAALSKRFPRFWVGAFVRFDDLHGATFEDSPLVRRQSAWAAGFAVAWMLGESGKRVRASY